MKFDVKYADRCGKPVVWIHVSEYFLIAYCTGAESILLMTGVIIYYRML